MFNINQFKKFFTIPKIFPLPLKATSMSEMIKIDTGTYQQWKIKYY